MTTREVSGISSPPGKPLVRELEDYRRQFEAIKEDADNLLVGLTGPQFNWRPEPGRWSVAECLVHLNVVGDLYLPVINDAIKRARGARAFGEGPFRHGFFGNWFIRSAEPPPRMRFKAPKKFAPSPDHPIAEVSRHFFEVQDLLTSALYEANGLHLSKIKLTSPATNLIRLSLGQSFGLMAAHERRHLWQARQVKNDPRFPQS